MILSDNFKPVTKIYDNSNVATTVDIKTAYYDDIESYLSDDTIYTAIAVDDVIKSNTIKVTNDTENDKFIFNNIDIATNPVKIAKAYKSWGTYEIKDYNTYTVANHNRNDIKYVVGWDKFENIVCRFRANIYDKTTNTNRDIDDIQLLNDTNLYVNSVSLTTFIIRDNAQRTDTGRISAYINSDNFMSNQTYYTPVFTYRTTDKNITSSMFAKVMLNANMKDIELSKDEITDGIIIKNQVAFQVSTSSSILKNITLKFRGDIVYKWLANLNICVSKNYTNINHDYVSGMNKSGVLTSEFLDFDDWKNSDSANNSSYDDQKPPAPDDDEKDNVENMNLSYLLIQNTAPFSRYYICTSTQLASLAVNISDASTIPAGLNVFDNIVFLQCYPVDLLDRFLTNNSEIIIANWPSGVNALRTTSQITVTPAYYVDINRHYNDFRDFAPISKYELYLPLLGMYQLPDFCVGCSVKIQILYDLISCEMIYHISVSDRQKQNYTLLDKIKCVCGTSISFKAENNSIKLLENRQNILNTINATTAFVSSLATKNVAGTISATTSLASSFNNDAIINNKSRTQAFGQNTSVASFNDVSSIYLYITRTETKIPSDYEKTKGYIYNNNDTLENHSGLCICDNVNVNNIDCTFTEKEMIKNILESYFFI